MPESPPPVDHKAPTAIGRIIRWDALAAIVASLVGLLALLVAGYTAYIQREQVRAQVWPYLAMGSSNADGQYEFVTTNKGVGPVIVRSVQVLVAGKPVNNWAALREAIAFEPTGSVVTGTLDGTVLAPGETLHWIRFANAADVDQFRRDWAKFHVEARVCYASTLGETWLVDFRPGWPGGFRPRAAEDCPRLPAAVRFDD